MVWATAHEEVKKTTAAPKPVTATLAFYRKYTEALLRRYTQMSMEIARVPSLLGRELFRGKVTNYVVHGFDDVVIFVHDVEQCLKKLNLETYQIIERIGLQEYTLEETAETDGPAAVDRQPALRRCARCRRPRCSSNAKCSSL